MPAILFPQLFWRQTRVGRLKPAHSLRCAIQGIAIANQWFAERSHAVVFLSLFACHYMVCTILIPGDDRSVNSHLFFCHQFVIFASSTVTVVVMSRLRWILDKVSPSFSWISYVKALAKPFLTLLCCLFTRIDSQFDSHALKKPHIFALVRHSIQHIQFIHCRLL